MVKAYQVASLAYTLQCQDIRCQTILYALDKELPQLNNTGMNYENMFVAIERSVKNDELWQEEVVMKTHQEERIAYRKKADVASEAEEPMRGWLQKNQESAVKMPQEKVYLHLDNHSYFLGDTIWFKAYVRQTDTSAPSTISHVAFEARTAEGESLDGYLQVGGQEVKTVHKGRGIFTIVP